ALRRAIGRDWRQPDRTFLPGKRLRQCLNQFLVVAAGRADRDPQRLGSEREIKRGRRRYEDQDAGEQREEEEASALVPPQRRPAALSGRSAVVRGRVG